MQGLPFTLTRVEQEKNAELDACKLLGAPVFPKDFVKKNKIKPNDYFVAQVCCDSLPAPEPFPKKGFLYFFLDINTLKPKVIFTEEEPEELVDDINAGFDVESCGDPTCLQMKFGEGESFLFGEPDPDIGLEGFTDLDGKLTLLQIDGLGLPEGDERPFRFGTYALLDGYWVFLIREEDLKKGNFKNVEFVEVNS